MTFISPFDLETIFIDVFAGNEVIFLGIALLVIGLMAARFKMNNMLFFAMMGLFAVMFATFVNDFYIFFLVIAGLGIGFIIGKLVKN